MSETLTATTISTPVDGAPLSPAEALTFAEIETGYHNDDFAAWEAEFNADNDDADFSQWGTEMAEVSDGPDEKSESELNVVELSSATPKTTLGNIAISMANHDAFQSAEAIADTPALIAPETDNGGLLEMMVEPIAPDSVAEHLINRVETDAAITAEVITDMSTGDAPKMVGDAVDLIAPLPAESAQDVPVAATLPEIVQTAQLAPEMEPLSIAPEQISQILSELTRPITWPERAQISTETEVVIDMMTMALDGRSALMNDGRAELPDNIEPKLENPRAVIEKVKWMEYLIAELAQVYDELQNPELDDEKRRALVAGKPHIRQAIPEAMDGILTAAQDGGLDKFLETIQKNWELLAQERLDRELTLTTENWSKTEPAQTRAPIQREGRIAHYQ